MELCNPYYLSLIHICEAVFRNLADAAVFHIRAEDGGQHRTDLRFTLATVAFNHHHACLLYTSYEKGKNYTFLLIKIENVDLYKNQIKIW